ncbi:hypothetical protein FOZ60_015576, partial [Perkinsus olseni]
VEGLERTSRISLFAQEGYGLSALQGGVLDLHTKTHNPEHNFFWRLDCDEQGFQLVFAQGPDGGANCVHTTQDFVYILGDGDYFYSVPLTYDFIPDLSEEHRWSLRPWSGDDRRRNLISFATSCDNAFIYATTTDLGMERSDILVEINVTHDTGRYRTIASGGLYPVSATMLDGEAPYSGWTVRVPLMHTTSWSIKFTTLTVSNHVGWFGPLEQERFWQVDLITETILAVFQGASEPCDIYARPDGGLWEVVSEYPNAVFVEVWKPFLEPRPQNSIMLHRIVPRTDSLS